MNARTDSLPALETIAAQVRAELLPLAPAIDREGRYPEEYLRKLGALGGFAAFLPRAHGGLGLDLANQIEVIARVASACGATAFLVWCQSTCAWYLLHAPNAPVRRRYLAPVARGEQLAGTGMSNPVKHLAGIERMHLRARRAGDGYVVNGALPWISNVGEGHLAFVAAQVADEGYVMFAARCGAGGPALRPCPAFAGMEGTRTFGLRFNEVRIPAGDVVAHPHQFEAFLQRIKPGFVLGQTGIGFGLIEASLETIRQSNALGTHVNRYLDDQEGELAAAAAELRAEAGALARQAQEGTAPLLAVLKARARVSELTLRAANSAALHAGAKGYLMRHPAQRRLREAMFVAIVTPALKHLRKEIHDLERRQGAAA
jgi:alkylation response protein AidB-like acyl-CoA dehydrogenase